MAQVRSWMLTHKRIAIAVVVATFAVSILGFITVARATDQSQFCASCHEMAAYYDGWEQGPHADVACVDCHVDDGNTARLMHKMEAVKEVWSHVAKDPTFPITGNDPVADERCLGCHQDIQPGIVGFDHEGHRAGRPCVDCHASVGHEVSEQALRDAGTFNASAWADATAAKVAVAGDGIANLEGHRPVSCDSCHNMAETACESCHEPKHDAALPISKTGTPCTQCHTTAAAWTFKHPEAASCEGCHSLPGSHTAVLPTVSKDASASSETTSSGPASPACATCHKSAGVDWAFSHPAKTADCETCHRRPAKHQNGDCTTCHATGDAWAFEHPGAASCADCHDRPAGHRSGSCTTCHSSPGSSWAFSHPSSATSCTNCHSRPSGHSSRSCTACHSTGSSWAFRHPSSSSTCTNCHNRPSGHSSRSCTTCHATGSSWAFRHTSSTSCANCHNAPSSHYGSSCVSCHSPGTAFKNATFSHPTLKKHTYKSFACTKCHPSGYSSATCTACHESKGGGD